MADIEKVKQGCKCCDHPLGERKCKKCPYAHFLTPYCNIHLAHNALSVIEDLQTEIERLEKENGTLKLAVQSMPNWLNEKRPEVVHCPDCLYQKTCISTQSGIEPDGFCKWGKKEGR